MVNVNPTNIRPHSDTPEIRKYKKRFNSEILCAALWGELLVPLCPRQSFWGHVSLSPFGVKVMLLVCGNAALSCDCHGVVVKNELGVQSSGGQQLWLHVPVALPVSGVNLLVGTENGLMLLDRSGQGKVYNLINRRRFQQMDVLEGLNVLVTISGTPLSPSLTSRPYSPVDTHNSAAFAAPQRGCRQSWVSRALFPGFTLQRESLPCRS